MVVVASWKLTGLPTNQTMVAKKSARPKLKRGPAKATMIFCHGGRGREFLAGRVGLALDGLHGRHLRQRDVTAGGNGAEDVIDAVDFLRPERLAEPDGKLIDPEPAPFRGEEMAQLVDDDQDVKKEDDLEEGDDGKEKGGKAVVDPVGNHEDKKEDEKTDEPEIPEGGGALRVFDPGGLIIKGYVIPTIGRHAVVHGKKKPSLRQSPRIYRKS